LITAHRELEFLTQTREVIRFKPVVEGKWAELAYEGLWFSPLMKALNAFVEESQATVSGTVRVRLFKGQAVVTGRKSEHSLYSEELATYTPEDTFNHQAAVGFIQLWGLPTEVNSKVNPKKEDPSFNETLGRAIYQADQPTR
jgi:argininosuccinate synthase